MMKCELGISINRFMPLGMLTAIYIEPAIGVAQSFLKRPAMINAPLLTVLKAHSPASEDSRVREVPRRREAPPYLEYRTLTLK